LHEGAFVVRDDAHLAVVVAVVVQIAAGQCEMSQDAAKGPFKVVAGKVVSVGPWASTVPLTSTVRSQNSDTDPRLCVETSMTRPSSLNSRKSVMIFSSVWTSTPVNGSSSRMT